MRKDTHITRNRLIDAAEYLFAVKGIDSVTLADINRQAEQKNRNALQYHFGGKQALIDAVLDKHAVAIDERRGELIDQLGSDYALHDAIEVLILPLQQMLNGGESGRYFLRINSQLMSQHDYAMLRRQRVAQLPNTIRLKKMLSELLPPKEPGVIKIKWLLIDSLMFQGLCSYIVNDGEFDQQDFIDMLIDSIKRILA